MTTAAIEINNLNFSFDELSILDNINMVISQDDFSGVVYLLSSIFRSLLWLK